MTFRKNLLQSSLAVGATAVVGTIATKPDSRWYQGLRKPAIQPPAAVFPIAWTALYGTIIGASARALTAGERVADPGPQDPMPTPRERAEAVRRVRGCRRVGRLDAASGVLLVPYADGYTFATVLSARIDAVN